MYEQTDIAHDHALPMTLWTYPLHSIQFYHQPSFTATLATLPQTVVNRQWCYTRAQLYYKTYPVESIDQADPATPRNIGILAKCLFNITPPIYLHT
jgi:hypothetical protein